MSQKEEEPSRFTGEAWNYFVEELEKVNPETANVYLRYFKRFLEDNDYTADGFYEHVKTHMDAEDRRKIKRLESELDAYYKSLITDQGYHINTVHNYENAVLYFLEANYLKDRLQYRAKFNGSIKKEYSDSFEAGGKDKAEVWEIKELLRVQGEPRNAAAILFMRDTGLRVSDVVEIKIKHIQPVLDDPSIEWYTFEITPVKNMRQDTPLPANPVLGPEAIDALRKWIQHREAKYGLDNSDPEGYVFCAVYNTRWGEIGDKIGPNAISRMMKTNREKAGLEKEISPHSLRKTHSTNLIGAGVPERWVNIMQGKKGRGTQGAYQKPSESELIAAYRRGYPSLAIAGDTGRIKELEDKLKVLGEAVLASDETRQVLRDADLTVQELFDMIRESDSAGLPSIAEILNRLRK